MVRVVIQRHTKEGEKWNLVPLLIELRTAAMYQPGYLTGETLESAENPFTVMVIST